MLVFYIKNIDLAFILNLHYIHANCKQTYFLQSKTKALNSELIVARVATPVIEFLR